MTDVEVVQVWIQALCERSRYVRFASLPISCGMVPEKLLFLRTIISKAFIDDRLLGIWPVKFHDGRSTFVASHSTVETFPPHIQCKAGDSAWEPLQFPQKCVQLCLRTAANNTENIVSASRPWILLPERRPCNVSISGYGATFEIKQRVIQENHHTDM